MTPKFYSQSGEDVVLAALFPQTGGCFVEVGCIDGKRFSNTYHFELRGWTGLCVEAHADYIPLLKINRPHSAVIHAAAGPANLDSVTFYANRRGSLSTLDKSREEDFRRDYSRWFTGFEQQQVPLRSLSRMLDEEHMPPVDFISIDVEGSELDVLRGMDFQRHRPKVLLLEADTPEDLNALKEFLSDKRYCYLGSVSNNAFFREEGFPSPPLNSLPPLVELVLSPHPLDQTGEEHITVKLDWRAPA